MRSLRAACLLGAGLLAFLPMTSMVHSQDAASNGSQWQPDLHWRVVGPFRGGRTRAATGVRDEPNVFYMGQVNGGVWKTTDYGRTWNPIFDKEPTQSIGAIAVAPSDSNVVYVASGEGLRRPDLSVGNGIYRSNDAGKTWQYPGSNDGGSNDGGLRDGQQIPALAVDPRDPNRVFAAVLGHPYGANEARGIYRSMDGGQTWKKVLSKDANTGGSDVAIDPAHPDVVYAAMWESRLGPWEDGNQYDGTHGGLFKSTDGGETWKQLTKGLPENLVQIQVAIAPSDTNRIYATLSTTSEGGYGSAEGLGVYRSDDAGESWTKITDDPRPAMKIGGGDLPIPGVDSKNPDIVYSASIVTLRSTDGGKTWSGLRGAPGGDDYQNIWINPGNPDIILLVSDQGALVTVNRGESWSSWYNQPTAQLYHVATTNTFPYKLCAGQQESGSVCISSRGNDGEVTLREWHPAGVIEYGYVAPDPLHPETIYGAGRTEVSKFDGITGQVQNITPLPLRTPEYRADRTEPIFFLPLDQRVLIYATNVLWETRDYGKTWRKISPDLAREHTGQPASLPALPEKEQAKRRGAIYSVAASFKNGDTLWAGTDDGLVWITRDHGKNWKNITPPQLTPWSKVTQISSSHFDDTTAYVSVSRFRIDDLRPYVYRTRDGGATWQAITTGLPEDSPVNTVREDPVRKGLLFAGTETAVWMSNDDGDHWRSLQYNLPHTSMRDLAIHDNDLIVATHGRSFWILDDISVLRQLDGLKAQQEPVLFKPGEAYRVRRSTYTDTPMPPDEPAGENPPDGAVIDYSLPASVEGAVTLEILDARNNVVRRYSSTDKPEPTREEMEKQLIPLHWLRMPKTLAGTAGMHRWVWNLRGTTPTATRYEYPISAVPHDTPRAPQGPLVLPGTYTVRLTANGKVLTAPLTIRMDPRVKTPTSDLEAMFKLESSLSDLVSRSARADLEAHSAREQIEKLAKNGSASASAELKDSLETQERELSAVMKGEEKSSGRAEEPGLPPQRQGPVAGDPGLDDAAEAALGLYGQIGQVDAAPTAAQQTAGEHVGEEVKGAVGRWERVKTASLPGLNRRLQDAHLPAIDLERRPETMPAGGDEE
jgi:photosystem II stability/assembly factor-like uncharacterized protein